MHPKKKENAKNDNNVKSLQPESSPNVPNVPLTGRRHGGTLTAWRRNEMVFCLLHVKRQF